MIAGGPSGPLWLNSTSVRTCCSAARHRESQRPDRQPEQSSPRTDSAPHAPARQRWASCDGSRTVMLRAFASADPKSSPTPETGSPKTPPPGRTSGQHRNPAERNPDRAGWGSRSALPDLATTVWLCPSESLLHDSQRRSMTRLETRCDDPSTVQPPRSSVRWRLLLGGLAPSRDCTSPSDHLHRNSDRADRTHADSTARSPY
jgi:hypothetical protein